MNFWLLSLREHLTKLITPEEYSLLEEVDFGDHLLYFGHVEWLQMLETGHLRFKVLGKREEPLRVVNELTDPLAVYLGWRLLPWRAELINLAAGTDEWVPGKQVDQEVHLQVGYLRWLLLLKTCISSLDHYHLLKDLVGYKDWRRSYLRGALWVQVRMMQCHFSQINRDQF